ncbi:MAG: hypothetical protein HC850_13945, partial [Rhodomicrobium sp.]|nr:hypothetical protein [Rhodomicrobium sp.]
TPISPARIVEAPALKVSGKARATIDNLSETTLTFSHDDIMRGVIKSTSTKDILESLFRSLARNLELEVNALGLGIATGPLLKGAVEDAVGSVLGALDEPLAALLELLGVSVGEADIRVNGVRCDRSVLVQ